VNPNHVTIGLIVVIVIFLAVDVQLYKDKVPSNTYSEIIRDTGNRWPAFRIMFIFSWGVLAGHWWW
jgi:hypothetical protein